MPDSCIPNESRTVPPLPLDDESTLVPKFTVLRDDVLHPFLQLLLYFVVFWVILCLVGAAIATIEGPVVQQATEEACAKFDAQLFSAEQRHSLQSQFKLGVPYNQSVTAWTWLNSQYFAATMLTTIGYGDMVPVTGLGRCISVMCGFVGIPLVGYVLNIAGKHFIQVVFGLQLIICGLFFPIRFKEGHYHAKVRRIMADMQECQQPLNLHSLHALLNDWSSDGHSISWLEVCLIMEAADVQEVGYLQKSEARRALLDWARRMMRRDQIHNPTILLYITTMVLIWLTLGAIAFSYLESIRFGDAWWFAFVTLSTIGYGDITATHLHSRLFWLGYIYVGFGMMARLLVGISYFIEQGVGKMVAGHIQFSLYYDWDFQSPRISALISKLKVLWPAVFTVTYAVLGGFLLLEVDHTKAEALHQRKKQIWEHHTFTPSQRAYLQSELDTPHTKWNLETSLQLATASITTVGYGNLVPNTAGGRAGLLTFAILGIGIVGLSLSQLAENTYSGIARIYGLLARLIGGLSPVWDEQHFEEKVHSLLDKIDNIPNLNIEEVCNIIETTLVSSRLEKAQVRAMVTSADTGSGTVDPAELMPLLARWLLKKMRAMALTKLVLSTIVLLLLALLSAAVFTQTDGWSYADSLWFTWLTASTIGFGDLVPSRQTSSSLVNVAMMLINLGFFANCVSATGPVMRSVVVKCRGSIARWKERRQPEPASPMSNSNQSFL